MATERPSTIEEYPRPLAQGWTRLATRGLDTLLVVNPASGNDLTGNVTFAVGTYQGLVVPTEGDVSLLTSELELPGGRPLVVDRGQAASAAGEDRLQTIRKRLERRGLTRGMIAIERHATSCRWSATTLGRVPGRLRGWRMAHASTSGEALRAFPRQSFYG
jgi:hypothetical protein